MNWLVDDALKQDLAKHLPKATDAMANFIAIYKQSDINTTFATPCSSALGRDSNINAKLLALLTPITQPTSTPSTLSTISTVTSDKTALQTPKSNNAEQARWNNLAAVVNADDSSVTPQANTSIFKIYLQVNILLEHLTYYCDVAIDTIITFMEETTLDEHSKEFRETLQNFREHLFSLKLNQSNSGQTASPSIEDSKSEQPPWLPASVEELPSPVSSKKSTPKGLEPIPFPATETPAEKTNNPARIVETDDKKPSSMITQKPDSAIIVSPVKINPEILGQNREREVTSSPTRATPQPGETPQSLGAAHLLHLFPSSPPRRRSAAAASKSTPQIEHTIANKTVIAAMTQALLTFIHYMKEKLKVILLVILTAAMKHTQFSAKTTAPVPGRRLAIGYH